MIMRHFVDLSFSWGDIVFGIVGSTVSVVFLTYFL